ncbi:hypothetical protein VHUM_01606 [Vanrija humicola]|uniref:Uncharacterized protein n=1 Tax=Vanrija humicola TaxID=5417 RepID=A0A7D8V1D0_VANHU|nr:hypothetical protein VHUM_01606 [Vanrija humicola]
MIGSTNYPPLPQAQCDTLYAFYPYPLRARERVHASLRGPAPLSSTSSSSAASSSSSDTQAAVDRAARRALRGKRPAGVALGKDAADLSDEEAALEDDKHAINAFGHRFLLPFGRRLTQMEMEAAPSPTPSDHEHRQEDRGAEPPSPVPPSPELGDQDGEIDLDASLEDRDADPDQSTEYDSDDLRLMRNMDRSIGTHTPESADDRYHEEETMEEE